MKQRTKDNGNKVDDWATPKWLYDSLNMEFGFDFDPCPMNPEFDGLNIEWGKSNFVNPPYSTKLKSNFIRKGFEEWMKGKTVVFLIPPSIDTKDFHNYILPYAEIRYICGRVCFEGYDTKGKFVNNKSGQTGSMICILRNNTNHEGKEVK